LLLDGKVLGYRYCTVPSNNVICVSSTNKKDEWRGGNIGQNTVHVMAPGVKILSTVPHYKWGINGNKKYDTKTGTSMATPLVSALAAMVMTIVGDKLNGEGVKHLIMANIKKKCQYERLCISGGQIDYDKTIEAAIALVENKQLYNQPRQHGVHLNVSIGVKISKGDSRLSHSGKRGTTNDLDRGPTIIDFDHDYLTEKISCREGETREIKVRRHGKDKSQTAQVNWHMIGWTAHTYQKKKKGKIVFSSDIEVEDAKGKKTPWNTLTFKPNKNKAIIKFKCKNDREKEETEHFRILLSCAKENAIVPLGRFVEVDPAIRDRRKHD